jgi:hypothetical protein
MAGYSATPLQKKLGMKEGYTAYFFKPPPDYFNWIAPLPSGLVVKKNLTSEVGFIHLLQRKIKCLLRNFYAVKGP